MYKFTHKSYIETILYRSVFGRRLAQESRQPCATYDEYLDQTCELNVRNIHPAKSGEAQD